MRALIFLLVLAASLAAQPARLAVQIHPAEGLTVPPGLYVSPQLPGDGLERWARLTRLGGGEIALAACQAPNGELSVWNADLTPGGFLGSDPLACDVLVKRLGEITRTEGVELYDGGGFVAFAGDFVTLEAWQSRALSGGPGNPAFLLELDEVALFPNAPSDVLDTGAGGSARMAGHVRVAVRVASALEAWPPYWLEQLNTNLRRPGVGFVDYAANGTPTAFRGVEHPNSTADGGYRSTGGWGSTLHGSSEHFGRPSGHKVSPWKPDDYYHFAAQQWIAMAAHGSVAAAVHVRGMIERQWIHVQKTKLDAARGYRMIGDLADAVVVFEAMGGEWAEYAEHLLDVFLPALLAKLEAETAKLDESRDPAWPWNVGQGPGSDHAVGTQCSWMTGQLVIGLRRAEQVLEGRPGRVALRARVHDQLDIAGAILLVHAWDDDDPKGWVEDVSPYGPTITKAGTKHAITGKYRQWILPALEELRLYCWEQAKRATDRRERTTWLQAAQLAAKRADWLARELVRGGWFGSSSAADKGWRTFLADEAWLTAGRLGSTSRATWAAKLGA